jgi:cyclopropane fatty-acyl-phospholipid synthase-like methyltransferase/phosphatidylglycerophosphate synthase
VLAVPRYQAADRSLVFPYYRRFLVDPALAYLPARLDPDVITHVGHLLALAALAVVAIPDARGGWPLVAAAVLLQLYVWCDNADGAHARRTGQTSTSGEYLDHGLDLACCAYIGATCAYAVGAHGPEALVLASVVPAAAALTCWEQSVTGVFRLGWLNQIEAVAATSAVLVTGAALGGVDALSQVSLAGVTLRQLVIGGSATGVVVGIVQGFVCVRAKRGSLVPGLALLALHLALWGAHAVAGLSAAAAYAVIAASCVAFGTQALLARLRLQTPTAATAALTSAGAVSVLVVAATLRDGAATACLLLLAAVFAGRATFNTMAIVRRLGAADERVRLTPHGAGVEKFYSHGAERRAREANGFLSFGYWKDGTTEYTEATQNLLELVLDESGIEEADLVLNVACGNGVETMQIYERFKPRRIHGIEITRAHVETSRRRAAALGLSKQLVFEHGDACRTSFDDATFTQVIGIEGIAHFDTRELFIAEAHRVLKPGGLLMLTDCVLHRLPPGPADTIASALCSRFWHMPRANWTSIPEDRALLERHGFEVEFVRSIGDRVYPGFARFNVRREAIVNNIEVRGLVVGLGLAFICWLVGDVYRRGVSDYVLVKAFKR